MPLVAMHHSEHLGHGVVEALNVSRLLHSSLWGVGKSATLGLEQHALNIFKGVVGRVYRYRG